MKDASEVPFDPERAKETLAAAGWTEASLLLLYPEGDEILARMAERIAEMLGQVDIAAKPMAIMASAYLVTLKAIIWAVMVVPMLAPIITPIDCCSDMRQAEIKPTSSTVVTDND